MQRSQLAMPSEQTPCKQSNNMQNHQNMPNVTQQQFNLRHTTDVQSTNDDFDYMHLSSVRQIQCNACRRDASPPSDYLYYNPMHSRLRLRLASGRSSYNTFTKHAQRFYLRRVNTLRMRQQPTSSRTTALSLLHLFSLQHTTNSLSLIHI